MDREKMEEIIQNLVMGFDCENGVPEKVYLGTEGLIYQTMGIESSKHFSDYVDACDGSFFIEEGIGAEAWEQILSVAVWTI